MSDIVPMVHPHQLAKVQRRFPLHYPDFIQMVADDAQARRGRNDLEFVLACNKRAIQTLVEIYDMSCLDEWERKRLRNSFRRIVARHGGRLAPYYDDLHRAIRSRLKEHEMMVRVGLDPPTNQGCAHDRSRQARVENHRSLSSRSCAMLENQIDQHERRAVMRNEQRVKEQEESRRVFADQSLPNRTSTYNQHAQADAQTPRGRFTQVEASTVIGSKADVAGAYPAASAAHQTELPPEPPTGYAIDELEASFPSPQAPDPTSDDAPSSPLWQRAGVGSLSQKDDPAGTNPGHFPPRPARSLRGPGRHPFRRRV